MKCIGLYIAKSICSFLRDKETRKCKYTCFLTIQECPIWFRILINSIFTWYALFYSHLCFDLFAQSENIEVNFEDFNENDKL